MTDANSLIDLRSDTVTRPTPAMLKAMADAPVGDDVYGDDPTVSRLQSVLAERTGKEAALFFPSGTQSNLAALMAHCGRGDEYIVGQIAHTYKYEGGGAAVLGSIQPQPIEHAEDGSLPLDKVRAAVKPHDFHFARTRLFTLENTTGGRVLPPSYVAEAAKLAREFGLGFHLDGARGWNAAVAGGVSIGEICAPFDSVSLCFSKGLGTPVGSALAGSRALVAEALRWRKMLGGGMRQSGFLAAACLHAMDHHFERLAEDHENAEALAKGLEGIEGMRLQGGGTNIRFFDVEPRHQAPLATHLKGDGIIASVGTRTRFVTHLDVSRAQVNRVIESVRRYFESAGRAEAAE
ncbi:low-specificity L-threonine aldolase [Aureimonas mangrovi]|uniref:low-specificity L-threonine aldolase n=1 Tax=Aureimonas mangrovi TaxID=2758041 RepID=UPI001AEDAF1F|nr:low-specificity L-threonine aldolase [Aureimonas mangrovi]